MKWGYIYKITNPIGQIYIGQTINIKKREWDYKTLSCEAQKAIYKSLQEYSWDMHKFEIILRFDRNVLNIDKIEVLFIELFRSLHYTNKRYGLNLTRGGKEGRKDIKHTEDAKLKIGNESRKRGCSQLHTREVRSSIGKKLRVPIYQFDKDQILIKKWDGIITAANYYEISPANIGKFARGKKGKYICDSIWSYSIDLSWCNKFRHETDNKIKEFRNSTRVPIIQLTSEGEFIKEWEGVKMASIGLGIRTSGIHYAIDTKRYSRGYKWMYAEEYYKTVNEKA